MTSLSGLIRRAQQVRDNFVVKQIEQHEYDSDSAKRIIVFGADSDLTSGFAYNGLQRYYEKRKIIRTSCYAQDVAFFDNEMTEAIIFLGSPYDLVGWNTQRLFIAKRLEISREISSGRLCLTRVCTAHERYHPENRLFVCGIFFPYDLILMFPRGKSFQELASEFDRKLSERILSERKKELAEVG